MREDRGRERKRRIERVERERERRIAREVERVERERIDVENIQIRRDKPKRVVHDAHPLRSF